MPTLLQAYDGRRTVLCMPGLWYKVVKNMSGFES